MFHLQTGYSNAIEFCMRGFTSQARDKNLITFVELKCIQMKPKSYGILRVVADILSKRRQLFTIRRSTISPKQLDLQQQDCHNLKSCSDVDL
jgi:hypothetical protein